MNIDDRAHVFPTPVGMNRVRRELGVAKLSTKYNAFLNHFDSGMEIKKIAETVGTSVDYVRECLIRFGRIERGVPGKKKKAVEVQ